MVKTYQFSCTENLELEQICDTLRRQQQLLPETGDIWPERHAPILIPRAMRLMPAVGIWGFPARSGGVRSKARPQLALLSSPGRERLMRRRCVIPASAVYRRDRLDRRVCLRRSDGDTLFMAGLYDIEDDELHYLLLSSNRGMPALLPRDALEDWVFSGSRALSLLQNMEGSLTCKMNENVCS